METVTIHLSDLTLSTIHHFGCAVSYGKGLPSKCCQFESIWKFATETFCDGENMKLDFLWFSIESHSNQLPWNMYMFVLHNAKRCAKINLMPITVANTCNECVWRREFSGFGFYWKLKVTPIFQAEHTGSARSAPLLYYLLICIMFVCLFSFLPVCCAPCYCGY